jgi:hypothetical protein
LSGLSSKTSYCWNRCQSHGKNWRVVAKQEEYPDPQHLLSKAVLWCQCWKAGAQRRAW